MTFLKILAILVIAVFLLLQVPVGREIHYSSAGLRQKHIIGFLRLRKKPANKEKTKKLVKAALSVDLNDTVSGTLSQIMLILPVLCEALGALIRKVRIKTLKLVVVWGADEPADAAIGYGRAQAAIGMIWPLIDHNFKVKKAEFDVGVDYQAKEPLASIDAVLTMPLGQAIAFVVRYELKVIKKLLAEDKRLQARNRRNRNERKQASGQ